MGILGGLWYVFWYLPGGKSLAVAGFYIAGFVLSSVDTSIGTNFSSYYSVLAYFMAVVFLGFGWIGQYFCHLNVVVPLMIVWFNWWVIMAIVRGGMLLKGHIWSASR